MAERWVTGFAIDTDGLAGLVGSRRQVTDVTAVVDDLDEIDELLSERSDPISAEVAISQVLAGELDEDRGYEYKRCLEPLACLVGRRLDDEVDVVLTYYLPNQSHGRWDPVLVALELETLARCWGTSCAFPWSDDVIRAEWPIAMLLSKADTTAAAAELVALDPDAISKLPDSLLVKSENENDASETRDELRAGLATVGAWLEAATNEHRGLLMLMDGSQ